MSNPNPQLAYKPPKPFAQMSTKELEHELRDHLIWSYLYLVGLELRTRELPGPNPYRNAQRVVKRLTSKFEEK